MATFILVHGSFHGAWCWQRLTPLLQAAGHKVIAPDLPGSGADPAPLTEARLSSYAGRIAALIDAQREAPVLVGHSMGAIVCAQVAEQRAWRIAGAVFVCGLLLRSGETLTSFLAEYAHLGIEDQVLAHMTLSADGSVATFPERKAGSVFYNRCTPADAAWAARQLRPQATAVYGDPTTLTASAFGRVRRFYVEGSDDRAVSPTYQRLMVERTPCEQVYPLDCDHSPFLSAPAALAGVLQDVAERVRVPLTAARAAA